VELYTAFQLVDALTINIYSSGNIYQMNTPIDDIVKETKAAFVIAKSDGVLDVAEVISIAVELSQKLQKLANLSGSEKKSLLLHVLKKGLDTSGGLESLPGFASASAEQRQAMEDQLLTAASTAIDAIVAAASGKLDLRKPSSWKACLPLCLSAAQVVLPAKDQAYLKEASKFADKLIEKGDGVTTEDVVTAVLEAAPVKEVVAAAPAAVTPVVAAAAASIPGTVQSEKKGGATDKKK